jgi:hypothetical protein
VAGVGTLGCEGDEVDRCFTNLNAIDLANQGSAVGRANAVPAAGRHGRPAVKIGSLRVKRNGSMAWIMCPEREFPELGPGPEPASRRPNCVKTGDRNRVYKVEAPSERPKLLDKGSDIDPSSLRRKGSVISWVADGKRRRATLD